MKKILILEDEGGYLKNMESMIEEGFATSFTTFERFRKNPESASLYLVNDLDPYQVVKSIRRVAPKSHIIACSFKHDSKKVFRAGATVVIAAPMASQLHLLPDLIHRLFSEETSLKVTFETLLQTTRNIASASRAHLEPCQEEGLDRFFLGEQTAFKELYNKHYRFLFYGAYVILHDELEAKNIVQYVFVRLQSQGKREIRGSLESYLFVCVHHLSHCLKAYWDIFPKKRPVRESILDIYHQTGRFKRIIGAVLSYTEHYTLSEKLLRGKKIKPSPDQPDRTGRIVLLRSLKKSANDPLKGSGGD